MDILSLLGSDSWVFEFLSQSVISRALSVNNNDSTDASSFEDSASVSQMLGTSSVSGVPVSSPVINADLRTKVSSQVTTSKKQPQVPVLATSSSKLDRRTSSVTTSV